MNKRKAIAGQPLYASQQFRDCVMKGDIKAAQASLFDLNEPHPFAVTSRECTIAARCGKLEMLKWLVEKLNLDPEWKAVSYALLRGQYEAVLYLLDQNSCFQLSHIFEDYKSASYVDPTKLIPQPSLPTRYQFKRRGIELVFPKGISPIIVMTCALSRFYKHEIDAQSLDCMVVQVFDATLLPLEAMQRKADTKYTLENIYLPPKLRQSSVLACLLSNGEMKEWHHYCEFSTITYDILHLITSQFDRLELSHRKTHLQHLDNVFQEYKIDWKSNKPKTKWESPFVGKYNHCEDLLACLLKHVHMDRDVLIQWLSEHLSKTHGAQCDLLIDYANRHDIWPTLTKKEKWQLMDAALSRAPRLYTENKSYGNFLTRLQGLLGLQEFIWLDFKRRHGLYYAKKIRQSLKEIDSSFCTLIDDREPAVVPIEEKWCWIGFGIPGRESDDTYSLFDYKQVPPISLLKPTNIPIHHAFESILSLNDLRFWLPQVEPLIRSATGCYFHIDEKTSIFYRDSQGCVLWAQDQITLRIYQYIEDKPYEMRWVAHNLPEFLTRIKIENELFYGLESNLHKTYVKETKNRN